MYDEKSLLEYGSTINLTCIVNRTPEPPTNIVWTHNGEVKLNFVHLFWILMMWRTLKYAFIFNSIYSCILFLHQSGNLIMNNLISISINAFFTFFTLYVSCSLWWILSDFLCAICKIFWLKIFFELRTGPPAGGELLGGKHIVTNFCSYLEQNQYIRYSDTVYTNQN